MDAHDSRFGDVKELMHLESKKLPEAGVGKRANGQQ
jgi:hypothetical protein